VKNAIIFALLVVIGVLAASRVGGGGAQALIQDTTLSARPSNPTGASAPRKADFPVCVTIKPQPLLRTPHGRTDFRLGEPMNDKGAT
jgi:hypothetical protein